LSSQKKIIEGYIRQGLSENQIVRRMEESGSEYTGYDDIGDWANMTADSLDGGDPAE
jgi:hypothetical protein